MPARNKFTPGRVIYAPNPGSGGARITPSASVTREGASNRGKHAVVSGAAAEVLNSLLKRRLDFAVTSEALPGTVRWFTSFSAAGREASLSRIFAGQHFRFDEASGSQLGREVADFVVDHYLAPLHDDAR